MIELTDINGKIWWINPAAVSAVTACNHFGEDLGLQKIKTRTYIYIGALENVIQMAEEPEEVLRKLHRHRRNQIQRLLYPPEGYTNDH